MILISMSHEYKNIISIKNLCDAWTEFICGKKSKKDVAEFSLNLSQNIFKLHKELQTKTYRHGAYEAFSISDPKPRSIHKATVRDRLLHHAIYRILYPYFDKKFIFDSYSCRLDKGTHRAVNRLKFFSRKVSKNNTKQCWVLKCDIRKFFASVDHKILKNILSEYITDQDILRLLAKIINSFSTKGKLETGIPLGNLTSQLFANIYMNKFDQWMKHRMKVKYYIRYADDFVIISQDKDYILELIPKIADFLEENLKLSLHPNKISIKTLSSGIDFLGWVHFPHHRVLRTTTKKKMFRNLRLKEREKRENSINSYLGMLSWGDANRLADRVKNMI